MMQIVFPASTVSPSLTKGSAVGDEARKKVPTIGEATMCSSSSGGAGAGWVAAGSAETNSTGLFPPAGCGTFAGGRLDGAAGSLPPLRQRNRKAPRSSSNSLNSFFETNSISSLISVRLGYSPASFSASIDAGAVSAGLAALPGLFAGVDVILCFVLTSSRHQPPKRGMAPDSYAERRRSYLVGVTFRASHPVVFSRYCPARNILIAAFSSRS